MKAKFSTSEAQQEQLHQAADEALQHAEEGAGHVQINKKKKKKMKVLDKDTEIDADATTSNEPNIEKTDSYRSKLEKKNKEKKEMKVSEENAEIEADEEIDARTPCEETYSHKSRLNKKKKRLLKEAEKADKRGVCYLSRIPPHMDHVKLRHILSQFGDIQRIFLAPQDSTAQVPSKRSRGSRDQVFLEGWVEFTNKSVAKRVANMLNGEQIGGKKRSSFYYDLWNIKYLSKFKWDDLTEELALKKAVREQKIALELAKAHKERNFYLSKVDQSRALSAIEERLKKKQKVQQDSGQVAKVIRHFPQTKPIAVSAKESKPGLSDDILDAVFGGS